ncbi:MAG: UMP kinase [Clostridia bacterium]|nr:UMP kinase [Clostridia bacterium]MBQ3928027.1 UMP kinase [Clostridia bacterium]MBQ7728654.1 UMP kinase [Clostridia bacterium]
MQPKYHRVFVKLSGQALANDQEGLYDLSMLDEIAKVIGKCVKAGVQVCMMVGGGNIWRGNMGQYMDRTRADHMGMMATIMNALMLEDTLQRNGVPAVAMTAVEMETFAEPFIQRNAVKALEEGKVVIIGGGLGIPYFTTDTAAAVRGAEIEADVILMAKNIDAIYSADPRKVPDAKKFDEITYDKMLEMGLKVIDLSATAFLRDNQLKSYVFALHDPNNIYDIVMGKNIGTEVHN